MIHLIIYGQIAVLFAYFNKFKKDNIFLFLSFFVIFVFMAFRVDYGNDYSAYQQMFTDINNNISDYEIGNSRTEIGWILLNKMFKPFGFQAMIAFTSLISCICYYLFIVKFVDEKYHWFSILIYLLNTNYFLVQLSAMRQSMAIALFVLTIILFIKKRYLISGFIMIIAYLFHTSALLLVPILFLLKVFKVEKMNKVSKIVLVSIFIIVYFGGSLIEPTVTLLASRIFDEQYYMYLVQDKDNISQNLINILTYLALFVFIIYYYNTIYKSEYKLFALITIIGLFMLPLGFILPQAGRLSFYFLPVTIVLYPYYLNLLENKLIKVIFVCSVVFVLLIRFITFFDSETYRPYFYEYNSLINLL